MALFDPAWEYVLDFEGGYSNDPQDSGGETKYGVTKRWYPNVDIKNLTSDQAKATIQRDYWQFGAVLSQPIANKLLDMSVNMGQVTAIKYLQRSLHLDDDGVFGPITLAAVNDRQESLVLHLLRVAAVRHYLELPGGQKYLGGWLWRATA